MFLKIPCGCYLIEKSEGTKYLFKPGICSWNSDEREKIKQTLVLAAFFVIDFN
jgi:hypothetical protein